MFDKTFLPSRGLRFVSAVALGIAPPLAVLVDGALPRRTRFYARSKWARIL